MSIHAIRSVLGWQKMGGVDVMLDVLKMICVAMALWTLEPVPGYAQANLADIKQLESEIMELLPKIQPTVVSIESGNGSGSGVIVSEQGLVLTAAHVSDKATEMTVIYPDGRRFRAKALGSYGPADAGMIQMTEGAPHPFVDVAPQDSVQLNDVVLSMGHPSGFDEQRGAPLRIGHVLKLGENFIEIDNALVGGDSGGPSFDLQGRVIGIHSHISPAQVYNNKDSFIGAFLANWDSMLRGEHNATHYSQAVGDGDNEPQPDPSSALPSAENGSPNQSSSNSGTSRSSSKLQELREAAKANGGRLQLSREELQELRASMANRMESSATKGGSRIQDAWSMGIQEAFRPHCHTIHPSVHRVFVANRYRATATAIRQDGLLVTKASEVKGKAFEIEVNSKERRAGEALFVDNSLDLAIVRIDSSDLKPIEILSGKAEPTSGLQHDVSASKGHFCAAVNSTSQPAGFGIVSVAARPLDGKSGAFLGVQVEPVEGGVRVTSIKPGSPAEIGGMKLQDQLTAMENEPLVTAKQLNDFVQTHLAGESVRFDLRRDQTYLSLTIKLGDGAKLAPMPGSREQATDSMSTMMSKRRWFFASGIQHDCAIAPQDCGGPLIGIDGNILGINIARAGRIQSYAIPLARVQEFVQRFYQGDSK